MRTKLRVLVVVLASVFVTGCAGNARIVTPSGTTVRSYLPETTFLVVNGSANQTMDILHGRTVACIAIEPQETCPIVVQPLFGGRSTTRVSITAIGVNPDGTPAGVYEVTRSVRRDRHDEETIVVRNLRKPR